MKQSVKCSESPDHGTTRKRRGRSGLLGLAAALVLLASACVPSLQPFFTEKDLVTEPSLAGTWNGDDQSWTFTADAGAKRYTLTIKGQAESTFTAHLMKLDGNLFLDLFPKGYKVEGKEFYNLHQIPAHTLHRVRLEGDRLMLRSMDVEKVTSLLEADRKLVAHQFVEHEVSENKIPLLTAATPALQGFVKKHLDEIFVNDEFTMTRQKDASPN